MVSDKKERVADVRKRKGEKDNYPVSEVEKVPPKPLYSKKVGATVSCKTMNEVRESNPWTRRDSPKKGVPHPTTKKIGAPSKKKEGGEKGISGNRGEMKEGGELRTRLIRKMGKKRSRKPSRGRGNATSEATTGEGERGFPSSDKPKEAMKPIRKEKGKKSVSQFASEKREMRSRRGLHAESEREKVPRNKLANPRGATLEQEKKLERWEK